MRVRCAGDTWAVHRSAVSLHSTRCMHFRISKTTHCTLHVRCSDSAVRSLVIVAVAVGLWLRLSGHWSLVAGSALLLATLLPHSLLHATAPMQCELALRAHSTTRAAAHRSKKPAQACSAISKKQ